MQVRTISVKDMLPFQRPREKFVALGAKQMAMEELLAIITYRFKRSIIN